MDEDKADVFVSASEGFDQSALERAGWTNDELIWEQIQVTAAERELAGDRAEAAALWKGALEVAHAHFSDNDPRLATSLANYAVAQRRKGNTEKAKVLFEEALAVWDASEPWVAGLNPEVRARSSTFHLRLERKHPGGYEHFSRERYTSLASEGRARLTARRDGKTCEEAVFSRWQSERPRGLTDSRKLLAAVLLLAPGAD